MESEKFGELVQFTIEQSCVDDEPITRETRLYDDLGIYGDDAVDFLIAFGKKFNVNVSRFMAADYFFCTTKPKLMEMRFFETVPSSRYQIDSA